MAGSPILSHVLPVERVVAATPVVYAGQFRCAADDPIFPGGNPCSSYCVVFPRDAAWIQHEGGPRFLADPQVATMYNQGQVYRRWPVARRADRSDWLAFPAAVVRDAVARHSRAHAGDEQRPFRFGCAPVPPELYAAQRRLFDRLEHGGGIDAMDLEERGLALLDAVVGRAYGARQAGIDAARGSSRVRDAVEHVRQLLWLDPADRRPLSELSEAVALSPYHLCREFRRHTGVTISAYRTELRVRASLERVTAGEDLTTIALSLGFVSHSHFTQAFRRVFGRAPSRMRA